MESCYYIWGAVQQRLLILISCTFVALLGVRLTHIRHMLDALQVEGVALVALSQPLHWDVASIAVDGSMRLLETQAPGAEATVSQLMIRWPVCCSYGPLRVA